MNFKYVKYRDKTITKVLKTSCLKISFKYVKFFIIIISQMLYPHVFNQYNKQFKLN